MTPERVARTLVFVVGTRAQLIKVAPVVVACQRRDVPALMLMTGQHKETMADLVEEFGLAVPQVEALPAGEHSSVRALLGWLPVAFQRIRRRLDEIADREGLLDVVVHGDTLSTLLGAWAARRGRDRVVHLESGLSSGRLFDPFPEEICRRLVFRRTDLAICPNPAAAGRMARFPKARVFDSGGNTILDAVALAAGTGRAVAAPYVVVSLHRFQNLYDAKRLGGLVELVIGIARTRRVWFVLHPATRKRLAASGLLPRLESEPGIELSPRMGYSAFLSLAAGAECVLTDGGSNQEELAALGVPTIVMRERTERPDGLGRNARMEADVEGGVLAFLASGGHLGLRTPPEVLPFEQGPSCRIVDWLVASASAGTDG